MNSHRIDSPDGGHTAVLCDLGEIRFGPPYFALEIDNWSIAGRIFGGSARWSEDSTMFAIQEWLTTDYAEGPVTQLTVFDAARKRQCALARADKGYIVVTDFPPNLVCFVERYYASKIEIPCSVEVPLPGQWTWIDAPLVV
jgi:hypothetical protein